MNYKAKDAVNVWPPGDYNAELIKVVDGSSKSSGNPMQTLTYRIYNDEGKRREIVDYIVFPNTLYKLKQLAIAMGKLQDFEAETFQAEDYIGAGLVLQLDVQSQSGYEDKNTVKKPKAPTQDEAERPPRAESYKKHAIAEDLRQRSVANTPTEAPFGDEMEIAEADIPF